MPPSDFDHRSDDEIIRCSAFGDGDVNSPSQNRSRLFRGFRLPKFDQGPSTVILSSGATESDGLYVTFHLLCDQRAKGEGRRAKSERRWAMGNGWWVIRLDAAGICCSTPCSLSN